MALFGLFLAATVKHGAATAQLDDRPPLSEPCFVSVPAHPRNASQPGDGHPPASTPCTQACTVRFRVCPSANFAHTHTHFPAWDWGVFCVELARETPPSMPLRSHAFPPPCAPARRLTNPASFECAPTVHSNDANDARPPPAFCASPRLPTCPADAPHLPEASRRFPLPHATPLAPPPNTAETAETVETAETGLGHQRGGLDDQQGDERDLPRGLIAAGAPDGGRRSTGLLFATRLISVRRRGPRGFTASGLEPAPRVGTENYDCGRKVVWRPWSSERPSPQLWVGTGSEDWGQEGRQPHKMWDWNAPVFWSWAFVGLLLGTFARWYLAVCRTRYAAATTIAVAARRRAAHYTRHATATVGMELPAPPTQSGRRDATSGGDNLLGGRINPHTSSWGFGYRPRIDISYGSWADEDDVFTDDSWADDRTRDVHTFCGPPPPTPGKPPIGPSIGAKRELFMATADLSKTIDARSLGSRDEITLSRAVHTGELVYECTASHYIALRVIERCAVFESDDAYGTRSLEGRPQPSRRSNGSSPISPKNYGNYRRVWKARSCQRASPWTVKSSCTSSEPTRRDESNRARQRTPRAGGGNI